MVLVDDIDDDDKDVSKEVAHKRRHGNYTRGTDKISGNSLKTVPQKSYVYVGNLELTTKVFTLKKLLLM